MIVRH